MFVVDVPPLLFFVLLMKRKFLLATFEEPQMRKDEVLSREELMRPDLLSEIVLLGSGIAILVAFVVVIVAACASVAIQ
jgi:hypothetical protein